MSERRTTIRDFLGVFAGLAIAILVADAIGQRSDVRQCDLRIKALVGVYGAMTASIENQRRELAVRSALGASPWRLVRRVIGEGTLLTAGALVFGIAGSLAGARAIAGLQFGVPNDVWSLAGALCLIVAASAVAWIGPARRAARADRITVLRTD
jgi:putative ABC transport system permease protein